MMTMHEAQGVEFDVVFIVGIDKNTWELSFYGGISESLLKEKARINRDLLYVALTRAISELHVLGGESFKDVL